MIVAYVPQTEMVYLPEKQVYDENFAIYDYISRKYRFVGCFRLADGYADVYERGESANDSRLLLIAVLQIRGNSKADIKRFCDDIDSMKQAS